MFPAVTLEANTIKLFPLKKAIMDQLTYDCSEYSNQDAEAKECIEKSASVRDIVRPLAVSLLKKMFFHYREVVNDADTRSRDTYFRQMICSYNDARFFDWALFLNPMVYKLSVLNDTEVMHEALWYLEQIGGLLKMPEQYFVAHMKELVKDVTHVNISTTSCLRYYYNNKFSIEAKAMTLLIIKLLNDGTKMTLSGWNTIYYLGVLETYALNNFWDKSIPLRVQVLKGMESIVDSNRSLLFVDILKFLELTDFDIGFLKSIGTDSIKKESVQKLYNEILQVAKYMVKPINLKMTETARIRDLQDRALKEISAEYLRGGPNSYFNNFPAVLYCKFDQDNNNMCRNAVTTFTTSGLGHSFNTESFFQLYHKRPSLNIFCKEVVERKDLANCLSESDGIESNRSLLLIRKNSPNFALRLLLLAPQRNRDSWQLQRLALHSPYTVPDITGNFIEPSVGTHTTVVVTPHVTVTDDSLLRQDKSIRRCHDSNIDANPLALFKTYTRDNCIFECHLNKSKDACGCIPWYHPKLDLEDSTCSQNESICFKRSMERSQDLLDCSHCVNECWKVNYDYTLHTKPLKNICKDAKEIRDTINMVINSDGGTLNFLPEFDVLQELGIEYYLFDACYVYARKNVALVDIHIGPNIAVKITRRARVTFLQQLANLGLWR